jgi:2-dehydro-3-deoxyphosphogluconate aldolase/(4S)-4-hydroxy-2-oxoglutarate aldolase
MEITFRTAAAADSIEAVAKNVPDMIVGAGTVVNIEQAKLAVEKGAFISMSARPVPISCRNAMIPMQPGLLLLHIFPRKKQRICVKRRKSLE